MHRFVDLANLITLTSLLSALASVLSAIDGRTGWALALLIASGLIGLVDGLVARRLKRNELQKRFGSALDSLVDCCAFGFAPSIVLYCAGMNTIAEMVLLAALPVCVVWRVAYFEVMGIQTAPHSEKRYYTGLPSTYVALAVPAAAMLGFVGPLWFRWGMGVTVTAACLAMVSSCRVRKPGIAANAVFALLAVPVIGALLAFDDQLPHRARPDDSNSLSGERAEK